MREFRRTMARLNPDSPAPSRTISDDGAMGSLEPAPSLTVVVPGPVADALSLPRPSTELSRDRRSGSPGSPVAETPVTIEAKSARSVAAGRKGRAVALPQRNSTVQGPDFTIESARHELGARDVAGVDEAGRGPLAGPVVAAAVILDFTTLPAGLNDSKQLTAAERERLFEDIIGSARVSVASASAAEIDRWNIRQATLLAMTRALAGLESIPCHAIVDGRDVPLAWASRGTAVIEGDARSLSIAAASIVAKVTRDRMMRRLCESFPSYGFSRHMGYATAEHRLALERHGPCPFHRMTFSPIRQGTLDLG